jgi:acyl transferase domain-containing protein
LTAPNGAGIRAAMTAAYRTAGVDVASVGYIEAHGIAAPLGDAVELNALKGSLLELSGSAGAGSVPSDCHVGCIKPVIGHAELASGLAAICKVAMAFKHELRPGIPGFARLNPEVSLAGSPLVVSATNHPWPRIRDVGGREVPRRASINSFGFGGVNAHVVLQEPPPALARPAAAPAESAHPALFVLSARTEAQLRATVRRLADHLAGRPELGLADVAHTLQVGRKHFEWRAAVVAADRVNLLDRLRRLDAIVAASSTTSDDRMIHHGHAAGAADLAMPFAPLTSVSDRRAPEDDLAVVARSWCLGAAIDWTTLSTGEVRRVALPGYPFARDGFAAGSATAPAPVLATPAAPSRRFNDDVAPGQATTVEAKVRAILADELDLPADLFEPRRPLADYGADSTIDLRLLRQLERAFSITLDPASLADHGTLAQICAEVEARLGHAVEPVPTAPAERENESDPILLLLQRFDQGEIDIEEALSRL